MIKYDCIYTILHVYIDVFTGKVKNKLIEDAARDELSRRVPADGDTRSFRSPSSCYYARLDLQNICEFFSTFAMQ